MFNTESQPTITESGVESPNSVVESADVTTHCSPDLVRIGVWVWAFNHTVGGGGKGFHPLKEGAWKFLPCLEEGSKKFWTTLFQFCSPALPNLVRQYRRLIGVYPSPPPPPPPMFVPGDQTAMLEITHRVIR